MYLLDTLVACPSCNCHARPAERACPHCGAPMRREDGTVPRTASAILLGLLVATVAPTLASCSSDVESSGGTSSGGAGGSGSGTSTASSGSGSSSSSAASSSSGCIPIGADYGVGPTCPEDGGK